jgi:hypothetical protein
MLTMSSSTRFSRSSIPFSFRDALRYLHGPFLTALAVVVVTPIVIRDYFTFLSYGPGGLPHNSTGWLITNSLRILFREQLSTRPYSDRTLYRYSIDDAGFLAQGFPPQRSSARPKFSAHRCQFRGVSCRNYLTDEEMRKKRMARFEALGKTAQDKQLVEVEQGLYERLHSALFVAEARNWHTGAQQTRGECAHVHAGIDKYSHRLASERLRGHRKWMGTAPCSLRVQWKLRWGFCGVP